VSTKALKRCLGKRTGRRFAWEPRSLRSLAGSFCAESAWPSGAGWVWGGRPSLATSGLEQRSGGCLPAPRTWVWGGLGGEERELRGSGVRAGWAYGRDPARQACRPSSLTSFPALNPAPLTTLGGCAALNPAALNFSAPNPEPFTQCSRRLNSREIKL
jgi:hypothetical protein